MVIRSALALAFLLAGISAGHVQPIGGAGSGGVAPSTLTTQGSVLSTDTIIIERAGTLYRVLCSSVSGVTCAGVPALTLTSPANSGTGAASSTIAVSGTYANGTPTAVGCTWNPGAIAGTVSGATIGSGAFSQTCTTPVAGTYSLVVTGTGANTATDTHTGIVLSANALSSASCSGFSCAATTGTTVTVTFAYTGSAPTGMTYAWNSTCSGSGTGGSFSASSGTGSFTATAPSSACTGTLTATGTGPNTGTATTAAVTVTAPSGVSYTTASWNPGVYGPYNTQTLTYSGNAYAGIQPDGLMEVTASTGNVTTAGAGLAAIQSGDLAKFPTGIAFNVCNSNSTAPAAPTSGTPARSDNGGSGIGFCNAATWISLSIFNAGSNPGVWRMANLNVWGGPRTESTLYTWVQTSDRAAAGLPPQVVSTMVWASTP